MNNTKTPDHYIANSEFRYLYSEFQESTIILDSFLDHIQSFIFNAENKIGKNLEMYSNDFLSISMLAHMEKRLEDHL